MNKDKSKTIKKTNTSKVYSGGDPKKGFQMLNKLYDNESCSIPTGEHVWKKRGLFYLDKGTR